MFLIPTFSIFRFAGRLRERPRLYMCTLKNYPFFCKDSGVENLLQYLIYGIFHSASRHRMFARAKPSQSGKQNRTRHCEAKPKQSSKTPFH
jgi:hypothetical protein